MPSPSRPPSMRVLRLQTPHQAAEVTAADISEDDDSDTDAGMAAMESMHELEPEQAPLLRRRSSANPGPELVPGSSAKGAALVATSSSGSNQGAGLVATSSSGANQGPALGAAGAGAGGDQLEGQARAQHGQL